MKLTRHRPDFVLLITVLLLVSSGLLNIYSASMIWASEHLDKSPHYFFIRQCLWAAVGLIAMVTVMNLPYWKWRDLLKWLIPASLVSLLLVFVFPKVGGAHRWIALGPVSFQPSELATLTVIVYLSHLVSKKHDQLADFKKGIVPPLVVIGLFAGLVLIEPAMDGASLLAVSGLAILFAGGTPGKHLAKILLPSGLLAVALVMLSDYRRARLLAFLDPFSPENIQYWGYQQANSLYAVASGGWTGRGLGRSIEKFLYLPEPHTDFIFAILSEEWGTLGGILLIALFAVLIIRGIRVASRLPDRFGALLAVGITAMIGFAALANIGMVSAVLPVIGIPLPFVSYGGSSLLMKLIAMGLLLNLSRYTVEDA
ncbi:putative lipid II flippase FtsW [Effusibacillus pohliae]|uniref:putative lipid II flippase FtsW n=1 Tax=Effusibacillus pohliae TaxID=232270 RepID=UPI00036BD1DB|nr:putative lipid II flippase FtsW [Effusibacillus pohliae]